MLIFPLSRSSIGFELFTAQRNQRSSVLFHDVGSANSAGRISKHRRYGFRVCDAASAGVGIAHGRNGGDGEAKSNESCTNHGDKGVSYLD